MADDQVEGHSDEAEIDWGSGRVRRIVGVSALIFALVLYAAVLLQHFAVVAAGVDETDWGAVIVRTTVLISVFLAAYRVAHRQFPARQGAAVSTEGGEDSILWLLWGALSWAIGFAFPAVWNIVTGQRPFGMLVISLAGAVCFAGAARQIVYRVLQRAAPQPPDIQANQGPESQQTGP